MTPEEVDLTVRKVASRLFAVPVERLSESTDLKGDLGADSMALIDFVVSLEEAFDVQMDSVVDTDVRTLGDIVAVIAQQMPEQ